MAFDPDSFQQLADWLIAQRADEAALRTSISRLYYAAHLLAIHRTSAKGWFAPTGRGSDHRGVIQSLRGKGWRVRADQLRRLLELREHADYHLDHAAGVFNAGCDICDDLRRSSAVQTVMPAHWQDAREIGSQFLSQIRRL